MESITESSHQSNGKLNIPHTLWHLLLGAIMSLPIALLVYLLESALIRTTWFTSVVFGVVLGVVMAWLTTSSDRCRNRAGATVIAMVVGLIGGSTRHMIDYALFLWQASRRLTDGTSDGFWEVVSHINAQLLAHTGKSGFWGYMSLKLNTSPDVDLGRPRPGSTLPNLSFSGRELLIYWLIELGLVAVIAALINWTVKSAPCCQHCNAKRGYKVVALAAVKSQDAVIAALKNGAYAEAIQALVPYQEGNYLRLSIDYCPQCYAESFARLELAGETVEQVLWETALSQDDINTLLSLAQ